MTHVTELFTELVQIDSISGEEEAIVSHIASYLEEKCGLTTTIDAHNNVLIQTEGVGEPLFINAHVDTVEPGRGIIPKIAGEIITSQGETILGADNKGAVAAILTTLYHISSNTHESWRPLDVLFTTSEEVGCFGAIGFDTSKLRAKIGIIFDGTGDVGTIMTASPFYARFDISIIGKSAHAGYPEKATSTIPTMLSLITEIEELRSDELLVNIGVISAGTARNTIIGTTTLTGEIRGFSEEAFHEGIAFLESILSKQHTCDLQSDVVIENPGYCHSDDEVNHITQVLTDILGTRPNARTSYGVSDANIFNQADDLVVFNLGDGSNHAHTTHEEIPVQALKDMSSILTQMAHTSTQIEINQEDRK